MFLALFKWVGAGLQSRTWFLRGRGHKRLKCYTRVVDMQLAIRLLRKMGTDCHLIRRVSSFGWCTFHIGLPRTLSYI